MTENDHTPSPKSTSLRRLGNIQAITDGPVRYERRWTDCGSKRCHKCTNTGGQHRLATHGPYWYMIVLNPLTKKRMTIYIGHNLDTRKYRNEKGEFDHESYKRRSETEERDQTDRLSNQTVGGNQENPDGPIGNPDDIATPPGSPGFSL